MPHFLIFAAISILLQYFLNMFYNVWVFLHTSLCPMLSCQHDHYLHIFGFNTTNYFTILPPNSSFISPILFFCFCLRVVVYQHSRLLHQILSQHLSKGLHKHLAIWHVLLKSCQCYLKLFFIVSILQFCIVISAVIHRNQADVQNQQN